MDVAFIDASASVGLETIKRTLVWNHKLTMLSRFEINLPNHSNLKTLKGNAITKAKLKRAVENADTVLVALVTGKSRKATTLYSDFAKLLVEVQTESNTQLPFIVLTGFGARDSVKYNSFFMSLLYKLLLKDVYSDKTKMEEIITASKMVWEIVRNGMLKYKSLTKKYCVEKKFYKGLNIGNINRPDVADYLVKKTENATELYKYISLSNK